MDFSLTADQVAFQDMARGFARDRMAPFAAVWDAESVFPEECLREAAALGFAGIYCREAAGGAGLGRLDAALIFEELSAGCVSTAAYISIHNMVCWMIDSFGTEDQHTRFLPGLLAMDRFASYCLTEPGAGSDAASLRTSARRDGGDYVLDGTKVFISGGSRSDVYVVMARTGADGAGGISAFLVEAGTPGLSFGKKERKLGWNSQPTTAVIFDQCRVPAENRLGDEGNGFKFAMKALDGGRVNIASCSLGGARACLTAARDYARDRRQFGQAIASFQSLQFKLADMATDLDAARLLVHRAAHSLDIGGSGRTHHCAMAKRFATDVGFRIADEALQIHGGYGYVNDYPIERYFRDLRVHRILEGTNEIMRLIIARKLLEEKRLEER